VEAEAADLAVAGQAEAGRITMDLWRHQKMRRLGQVWAALLVVLVIILLIGLALLGWYISGYNKAVRLQESTKTAWANVETTLQRRMDLIPNLVNTVKGYAKHEEELFENIAKSREKYFQAEKTADRPQQIAAANELSGLLSRLLMLQENYPQLRASDNFRDLQTALEGTENRIAVARTRYNEAARELNSYAKEFMGSFFCKRAGVKPADYFEATERAKTEVPKVEF